METTLPPGGPLALDRARLWLPSASTMLRLVRWLRGCGSRNLTTFNYLSKLVRVVEIASQPWFVAQDVCNALGLPQKSHGYAVARLADDQTSLYQVQSGRRSQRIISESGLYKLVMRSDKPEAREFQDWVTRVVLPAIRKDGGYIVGEEKVAARKR